MFDRNPNNGSRNRATAKDFPFVNALPVAPVHDMVTRRLVADGAIQTNRIEQSYAELEPQTMALFQG